MKSQIDVSKIDKNMATQSAASSGLKGLIWFDARRVPFKTVGFNWFDEEGIYRRFPKNPVPTLPTGVEALCNHTAGGQLKFNSDSRSIAIQVKLREVVSMDNMTAISHSGFDLYTNDVDAYAFVGVSRFQVDALEYTHEFRKMPSSGMREFTLNFPLFNGVEQLRIGLEKKSILEAPFPFIDDRPVVIYGTSITHGACASRPGMCYSNILSRQLNRPFLNLGFSGSGKGEPETAKHIASIEDPAMFILDYEANCYTLKLISETLPEFIRILRSKHPVTPILVISKIPYPQELFDKKERKFRLDCKEIQIKNVEILQKQGDENICFLDGETFLGNDFWECSGDSAHPSNLGFERMAEHILPVIKKILL